MLRIALFTNNPDRQDFYKKMASIHEEVQKVDFQSNLHVFRARISPEMETNLLTGEYNIFFLPNLADYDIFVMDLYWNSGDRYLESEWGHDFLEKILAQKKPSISIGNTLEGFVNIGINAEASMGELMDHLTKVHQCRKFWLISDMWVDPAIRARMEACRRYMEQSDVPCTSHQYVVNYGGTMDALCEGFDKLLSECGGLPDAIVCSDDYVALGIMYAGSKKGFNVPKDYRIVGFGNKPDGICTIPSLTSVAVNLEDYGKKCLALIEDLLEGRQISKQQCEVSYKIEYRSSCGCEYGNMEKLAQTFNQNIFDSFARAEFGNHIERLESDLLGCDTVNQVGMCFHESCLFPDCEALYLVLDRDFSSYRADDAYLNLKSSTISRGNPHFPIHGYPKTMKIVFSYENHVLTTKDRPIRSLFPVFEDTAGTHDFLFMPIHFRQYTVGCFVIKGGIHLLRNPYFVRTIRALCITIENLYTKRILTKYNKVLADLSIKDAMTGFYNRLGYERLACRLFEEKKKAGQDLSVMFIDMDGLKKMNDTYGHECGDYALKAITTAIDRHTDPNTLNVRMGGDEFLILTDRLPDEKVEQLLKEIEEEIPFTEEVQHLPYSPGISVGYIHTDMTNPKNLDDYVREADEFMYEVKVKKGTARK